MSPVAFPFMNELYSNYQANPNLYPVVQHYITVHGIQDYNIFCNAT